MNLTKPPVLAGAVLIALFAVTVALWWWMTTPAQVADPKNAVQVSLGRVIYQDHCTRCHGAKLEGEPDWQQRKPGGRLPAPPHDASGHTWHHPDSQLAAIVARGITPFAPAGYQSDMPAFGGALNGDQIWAVLAFIKSTWPEDIQERQNQISRAQP